MALLFCGPAGWASARSPNASRSACCVGNRARRRASRAAPAASCQLFAAGTHPGLPVRDRFMLEQRKARSCAPRSSSSRSANSSERLALTPQYGGAQVAIIDPADAINHAASNALLKTLEEPHAGPLPVAAQRASRAPAGDDPQPLPARSSSACRRATKRWPGCTHAGPCRRGCRGSARCRARPSGPGATTGCAAMGCALRREVAADLRKLAQRRPPARSPPRSAGWPTNTPDCVCAMPRTSRWRRPLRLDRSGANAQAGRVVRHGQPGPRSVADHGARRPGGRRIVAGLARRCAGAGRSEGAGDERSGRSRRGTAGHPVAGDQGQGGAVQRLHAVPESTAASSCRRPSATSSATRSSCC